MNNFENIKRRWDKTFAYFDSCGVILSARNIISLLEPLCDALEHLEKHSHINTPSDFYQSFHKQCMQELEKSAEIAKQDLTSLILNYENKKWTWQESGDAIKASDKTNESIKNFLASYEQHKHGIDTRDFDKKVGHEKDFAQLGYKLSTSANVVREGEVPATIKISLESEHEKFHVNTFVGFGQETLEKLYKKTELETQEKMKDELFV
ncbi:MAG: hypothetical protein FWC00_01470 [Firmicutes bacterium]|nr:hypothetical protein [Bacillota bacterium]